MKSKKLFAILTLIAFMMTLVPALAFGAVGPASEHTTTIMRDKESVDIEIDEDNELVNCAKFTIYVKDGNYTAVGKGVPVYVASSRGTSVDNIEVVTGETASSAPANVVVGLTDTKGKVEFEVASRISGTPEFAFSLQGTDGTEDNYSVYDFLKGKEVERDDLQVIKVGSQTKWEVEFVAGSGNTISLDRVEIRNRSISDNTEDGVTKTTDEDGNVYYNASEWNSANGLDYYEVFVEVINDVGAPAYDQKVEFSSDKSDCYFSKNYEYTDRNGIASTKVYAEKAGTYEISFKAGSGNREFVYLTFAPAEVSQVILKSDNNRLLAKDTRPEWKFEFQDAKGNIIDLPVVSSTDNRLYDPEGKFVASIDAVDYPTDGDIKSGAWEKTVDTDNNWLVITPSKDFRKEGTYKSRLTLKNGEYAEFSFQIKEQGEITGLKLEYDQNTLCLGARSGAATVTWVDAAGVEKDVALENSSDIKFSASDYNKIDKGEIKSDGSFTVKNDKDYVGDLIITAFDTSNKLSASFKITIGRELSGIQVVEPADSIAVGETGLVTIKFVDLDGSQVAFGNGEVSLENGYAISKPADAKVSVGEGAAFGKGLKEDGEATLEVKSDKAGDVTFFVNVSTKKDGDTNERYYTATFKVNFGEPKKVAEGAAKKVVMFIGSKGYTQDGVAKLTDVAPFIKDSRTFVAVRPVADAFGVTPENIGWNEATQTVTLTRDDMTVTIVIGSNDIEIVKDGVVSTVEADVPAFIADGRTVLPFRAVGDAFGVTTNWDEATQSVTYEQ